VSPSETITPTAHYTGYVWARNGLSPRELQTIEGRVLYESLRPLMTVTSAVRGVSLEGYLLARHRAIDALLERAIEAGTVSQVIEVASGLSPRGWRFTRRYGDRLTYIETDLPDMADRKRRALEEVQSLDGHHRVAELDALADDGPQSLSALAAELDARQGVAIITEGLLGYLDSETVRGIWRRFARTLRGFPAGVYISDLHSGEAQDALARTFRLMLSAFVRGWVHLHFSSGHEAEAALRADGFRAASFMPAVEVVPDAARRPGSARAHVVEAWAT
jgi:O-methyltransferase involved in polyketide biosynthesis